MAEMGTGGDAAEGRGAVRIVRGARATESALLAEITRLAGEARRDPSLLARPVRLVVPSRSLREHVAARIVAECGSVVGIAVHTLRGLAFEILRRAGEGAPGGDALFPIVVRALARKDDALRAALDRLSDGYGVVAASVADLLDAGFEAHHADAVDEALVEVGAPALARAMVRVAARTGATLAAQGVEHRSHLFRRAREAFERDPEGALPARAILVHGFADLTAVQLDLLESLARLRGARILLDHPDDPAAPGTSSSGVVFTARLRERLRGVAPEASGAGTAASSAPEVSLLRAPGAQAEVRAAAERIRALLDAGARPERIGIVARELSPYALALRVQLRRLGIPFSGAPGSPGLLGPAGRRARALLDLLRERDSLTVDRWLDALPGLREEGEGALARARRADLRMGLHALGAGRLGAAAQLELDGVLGAEDWLPLPVRRGLESAGDADGLEETADAEQPRGAALRATRRSLHRALLEAAVERARACIEGLGRWPEEAPLAEHFARLASLLDALGWSDRSGPVETRERIDALRAELGGALRVSFPEFVLLLDRELRDVGVDALGGAGGGVRVLSVVEARAHTFDHLFVLGLNRDLFPRRVSEDPLLPDALRRALAAVLPDVPVKARGFDEERYLFAQLVSAAPRVALSWQALSDDGKEKTASPLVEGLLQAAGGEAPLAPSVFAPPAATPTLDGAAAPRPAFEHAIRAGLYGTPAEFGSAFALALDEARRELPGGRAWVEASDLARVRVAILDEMDASPRRGELGPWLGFVGPLGGDADPRHAPVFVTALEHLARCPWQSFLERILRIEAVPDALEALPSASPLLVGNLLHRTLERIVDDALGETPRDRADLAHAAGRDVPWPARERLDAILHEEARGVLRAGGIALPGFERLLVAAVESRVERVRRLEWGPAGVLHGVLGSEVHGEVEVCDARGRPRRVRFRADRADAGLRLTDYKGGKDPSDGQKTEASRRRKLLEGVGAGTWLQAAAYAFADPGVALGRYFFAKPELPEDAAELRVAHDDREVREAFAGSVAALLGAFDLGSFFPRLVTPDGGKEPKTCDWCTVSQACVRGDSATRRRLLRFVERARSGKREDLSDAESALVAVFDLGRVER